jgi:aryl-alcohol dehydrogenase-like predicted oxidoreductase
MACAGLACGASPEEPRAAEAVLARAVELGINLMTPPTPTVPRSTSARYLRALHPYPENLVIATKGGYTRQGPGRWRTNGRPKHLREACEGSLRRLKLDRIDLYQLHRPDRRVPFEDSIETSPSCARRARSGTSASPTSG